MASRSIFTLRVARCPSCAARLPARESGAVVVCEYCDARVEFTKSPSAPARGARPVYKPELRLSRVITTATIFLLLATVLGAYSYYQYGPPSVERAHELEAATAQRVSAAQDAVQMARAAAQDATQRAAAASARARPTTRSTPSTPSAPPTTSKPSRPASTPKGPSGPVLSVAAAKAALEPKVLACLQKTKTHSVVAYLGNKGVGAVSLLSNPGARVDGLRKKLGGTALGRCINDAGKTVRTRANKSNYVRLDVRNPAVADPLASLPAKADRSGVRATIEAVDPKVHACARSHGEESAREVFYFRIDGPTGAIMSVRGSYRSKAFLRCAEGIYKKLRFDRVQEPQVKYTHQLVL